MPTLPKNKKSAQLRLAGLEERSFSCQAAEVDFAQGTIDMEVQADMGCQQDDETVTTLLTARFFYQPHHAAEPPLPRQEIAHLTAQMIFHVPGVAQVLEPTGQPNELRLPTRVAATLIGTAYSTLRGMVFVRFAHTPLRQAPLGLIDPTAVAAGISPFRLPAS